MNESLERMAEEQRQKLRPLVYSKIPPTDREDVLQDIMISLLISYPSYRGLSTFDTFSQAVARHCITNFWRKCYRRQRLENAVFAIETDRMNPHYVPPPPDISSLRPSERAVLRLLGKGMSNGEIAASLFRTTNTVKTHLKSIYKKIHCRDRARVAILASKIFKEDLAND